MTQPYLNALEELVTSELAGIPGLVCKHFFSGAACLPRHAAHAERYVQPPIGLL
ncbi:MAG: hypothetical protein V4805_06275 [Pseudomonadota bacterium]